MRGLLPGFFLIRDQLQWAADLDEKIIEGCKVEAIASPHVPRLLRKLKSCCCKTTVSLIDLLACFLDKSDMEPPWICLKLLIISECPGIAQYKREAVSVCHDNKGFPFLLQELEIEVVLEKGACFGEVVYTEIEVVELHKILLRLEVRCHGAECQLYMHRTSASQQMHFICCCRGSEHWRAGQLPSAC
jgi:hypothetical protein